MGSVGIINFETIHWRATLHKLRNKCVIWKTQTSTKCVCTDLTEVTIGSLTLSTVYQVYCVVFLYQLSGSCDTPRSLSNGQWRYSSTIDISRLTDRCLSGYNLPTGTSSGTCQTIDRSRVTYTCNTGYLRTAGSSSRTCQSNGQWSGSHPTCTRKSALCHFTFRLQTCKRIDCMHNNPFHF